MASLAAVAGRLMRFRGVLPRVTRRTYTDTKREPSVKADAGPLRYTDSGAEKWSTMQTFGDPNPIERPWYERYIVILSTSVFLIYFCMLREENDMDEELARPLYERVPALERADLLMKIEECKRDGRDASELRRRLRELS